MTKAYPNERDCEHGSMRGKCDICEYEQDISELELKLGIAETEVGILKEENQALKARIAELGAYLDNVKTLSIYVAFHDSARSVSLKQARKWLEILKLEQQAKGVQRLVDNWFDINILDSEDIEVVSAVRFINELREQAKQLKGA